VLENKKNKFLKIGERIRIYRESKNISQFELALRIGGSQGMISRIERNKVYPSEKTIKKISKALGLNVSQSAHILGIYDYEITESDILNINKKLDHYFKKITTFSYLIDNFERIIKFSTGFTVLSSALNVDLKKFLSKNIEEVIFDYNIGLRKFIPKNKFEEIVIPILQRLIEEKGYLFYEPWFKETLSRLEKLDNFNVLLNKAKFTPRNIYSESSKSVDFCIPLFGTFSFFYETIQYSDYPGFIIVNFKIKEDKRKVNKILKKILFC